MQTEIQNSAYNDENENENASEHPDETIHWKKCNRIEKIQCKEWFRENLLLLLSVAGVATGFALGFGLRGLSASADALQWIEIPGKVFLRLLTMCIVPLVVSSVISGCAALDSQLNGKVGLYTLIYVLFNNAIGSIIGIALAYAIKPGEDSSLSDTEIKEVNLSRITTMDIFSDLIRNIFPGNIINALIRTEQTVYKAIEPNTLDLWHQFMNKTADSINGSNAVNISKTLEHFKKQVVLIERNNLLGVLFFSTCFGIACGGKMKPISKPVIILMKACMEVILKLMQYFLWFSPIGIASLVCAALLKVDDMSQAFEQLGFFTLTVVVGLLFHQLIVVQVLYVIFCRRSPILMFINSLKSWITVFATTSTIASLPVLAKGCETHGIDKRIYSFTLPMCCTTNRPGSAIFVSISAIFIAQMNGIDYGGMKTFTIGLLVTVAMLALPGVPSGSMVTLLMILTSTSLPTEDIAILFTVEWLLDRIRSTNNALSICYCAGIMDKLFKSDIERWDMQQAEGLLNPTEAELSLQESAV